MKTTRLLALACLVACTTAPQPRPTAEPVAAAPTPAVEGIVVGPDGKGVAGATVAAVRYGQAGSEAPRASALSTSGADGHFRLEGLTDGTYGFTATIADLAAAYAGDVAVSGGRAPSALRLALGGEGDLLEGVARDGEGKPLAGAEVRAVRMSDVDGDVFFARAAADGSYRLMLPSASYGVLVALGDRVLSQSVFVADPERRRPPPAEVVDWLRASAIPLTTVEAGHGFDDMAPLRKVIGDARVVALGEATHGTREFFQLKHRMLEFLVSEMGFTTFAIEATMPEGFDVNEYVLTGRGDPAQALSALYFWTWDTEEVLDLIRWMRRWNADPAHPRKVKFYGFDMQYASRAVRVTLDYLRRVDPERAARTLAALSAAADPLRGDPPQLPPASRQAVVNASAELIAAFDEHRADWSKRTGADAWALARQHARIVQQNVERAPELNKDSYEARDRSMAENVRWILEREGAGAKIVLWGHNSHVAAGSGPLGSTSAGVHLRKAFGADLVVFGLAFDRGSFQAQNLDPAAPGLRTFTVVAAPAGSLEGALAAAGLSLAAIDLRPADDKKAVAEWLAAEHATRSIGAVFSEQTEQASWTRESPRAQYDALLFVKETTAARANPSGKRPPKGAPLAVPRDLDFEEGKPGDPPAGWEKSDELGFQVVTTDSGCPSGRRCAVVRRKPGAYYGETAGRLEQTVDATPYRGKRVRLRAQTRAAAPPALGRAELYARADGSGPQHRDIAVSEYRDVTGATWRESMLEIDVPADAQRLWYGLGLSGVGEASIDAVTLEVMPPAGSPARE